MTSLYACGRSWTILYVQPTLLFRASILKLAVQLFLEEERERELEALYETGIAGAFNASDAPIGSRADDDPDAPPQTEATAVTKQTTETLMAGEKIMEALDLADGERAAFQEYEEAIARMPENDTVQLQPPPRNPVLAAYNLEPEAYVLQIVEKIPSTSLHDAMLVLPFGKVVSLMNYLNLWAQKVGFYPVVSKKLECSFSVGVEHHPGLPDYLLPTPHASSPDRCQPHHAHIATPSTKTSAKRAT